MNKVLEDRNEVSRHSHTLKFQGSSSRFKVLEKERLAPWYLTVGDDEIGKLIFTSFYGDAE